MVYVRLDQEWTDGQGNSHPAGEMVDVDAATLAELEAKGVVTLQGKDWAGPTGDDKDWAGPTGGDKDWAGPTGGAG